MDPTRGVVRRSSVAAGCFLALVAFALTGPILATTSPAVGLSRAVGVEAPRPTVGPPRQVADPVPDIAQSPADDAAVAFGASNHLVAWVDARGGIWAARVAPSGEVIDRTGFPVNDLRFGRAPAISFDGDNFLVVWGDGQSVLARRVSPEGTVLDDEDITLTADSEGGSAPSVAFDGTNHLVVWSSFGDDWLATRTDVLGRRVAPSGALVDSDERVLSATPTHQLDPRIAFNGSHHLIVWQTEIYEGTNVAGALVGTDGTPIGDPAGIPISAGPQRESWPMVTAVGSSFFVVWEDARSSPSWGVYGTAVDAAGTVVSPTGILLGAMPGSPAEARTQPSIVSNGTDVLVTWEDGQAVRGRRADRSGQPLEPAPFELPGLSTSTGGAFDGTNYLVAGTVRGFADPTYYSNLAGTRLSPAGQVLDPTPVTIPTGANAQREVEMAAGGDDRLVVWIDSRPDAPGLYGGRVGPDGEILDGTGIPIAVGTQVSTPAVAYDGTQFLVTWAEGSNSIVAAMVTTSGEVSPPFTVSTTSEANLSTPAVAFGGGTFLVTWGYHQYDEFLETISQVRASRVSTDGVVADPAGVRLSADQPMVADAPRVVYGDAGFLVVWDQTVRRSATGRDIHGARVATSGGVIDPGAFPISQTDQTERHPDVAWNGERYLVVWEEQPGNAAEWEPMDVRGARVTADGVVEDRTALRIATGTEDDRAPRVAANGAFLVAWTRPDGGDHDVLATEVESNGFVGEPGGFVVAGGPTPEVDPSVTAAPGDRNFSVAFQGLALESPYGTHRAFTTDVRVAPK